ncbi:DUF833-domain-containing protein [Sparassis latifolia]|uniref:Transport and Golgi organization 2 n=1 Tax=Sparassis crispa TaxID=139825 RepID=A0A401GM26_9APHY|nr:Transport and Golgi organization 2 [Sparassis crispa]GBE83257.1 Transport and Golgi organization 2 [Sparassis crispa]
MCVGFWCLEHPRYALIMCSNRDEYLSRPTSEAHFHSFESSGTTDPEGGLVLSGRDLLAGGTWAGIGRTGRIAFLTNITESPKTYNSSRGDLTSSFLLHRFPGRTLEDEVHAIVSRNGVFAGFNLLLSTPLYTPDADGKRTLSLEAAFVTNSGGAGTITARHLSDEERRCGGMSNGIDRHGASEWTKVKHGTRSMQDVLDSITEDTTESEIVEHLFGILTWKCNPSPLDRSELRNTIQVEPLVVASPDSAHCEYYGTRLSTVILIGRNGSVLFVERDVWALDAEGRPVRADAEKQRVFRFQIEECPP